MPNSPMPMRKGRLRLGFLDTVELIDVSLGTGFRIQGARVGITPNQNGPVDSTAGIVTQSLGLGYLASYTINEQLIMSNE